MSIDSLKPVPVQPPNDGHRPEHGSDFHEETAAVLKELRPALAEIVGGLQPPVVRVVDLRRRLNLGQQICWGLFNAATTRDIHEVPALLPGRRGMERFFEASARQGIPAEAIERARVSYERFERSVARHARSRDAFAAMAAQGGNGGGVSVKARQKRTMFRSASLLWGREARASLSVMVLKGGEHGTATQHRDYVVIKGLVGLHRTAVDVPLHAISTMKRTLDGNPEATPVQAIDPRESDPESVGLMRDFCSKPLPSFRVVENSPGSVRHELLSTDVGAASEVTYFTGHVGRGVPLPPVDEGVALRKLTSMPEQHAFIDVLMHESVWPRETPPDVKVYATGEVGRSEPRDSELLPVSEVALYMGRGVEPGRTPLIPKYVDLMLYALGRVGWNPEEFRLFRCHVEFPIVQSFIRLKFILPTTVHT